MNKVAYPLLSLLLLLTACNDPKLDTKSAESTKASIEKIRENLDTEQKEKLSQALTILTFDNTDFKSIMRGTSKPEDMLANGLSKYDGQNYEQLTAAAEDVKLKRKQEQKKQASAEIIELEKKLDDAKAARSTLDKVEVTKSRFYEDKSGYRSQPIIDITVKNGTDKAISRIYFIGTLASPGRSVPWVKDDFNYKIRGGLEPSETANWKLEPNSFGDWGRVDVPSDAVLTVVVTRIDDAEEKELANAEADNKETLERLERLKSFVAQPD